MSQLHGGIMAFPEYVYVNNPSLNKPDREQCIREIAYFKWLNAPYPKDTDLTFWLQAETEYNAHLHTN